MTTQYLGVTLTDAERRELYQIEKRTTYVNPYEAYGHHTGYGIEDREQYINQEKK